MDEVARKNGFIVAYLNGTPVARLLGADKLGWNAGNLHWRVRFEDDCLVILLDGPIHDYRARIMPLLEEGEVAELANV